MEKLNNHNTEGEDKTKISAERGEKSAQALRIERAREDTSYWAREYYRVEKDFKKRLEKGEVEYDEFLKWEDDARFNYKQMMKFEAEARFPSIYERDKAENFGTLESWCSVEAKAGDFYRKRQRALNEKIEQSEEPTREADLEAAQDLYRCVGEHIYYETDYETKRHDYAAYQRNRQSAHNALIRQLNYMNELAEKYGVERFTFRDFETNDFWYDEKLDIGKYTDNRAEYDRSTVEMYCRNAFSSQYDKAMRDNGLTSL